MLAFIHNNLCFQNKQLHTNMEIEAIVLDEANSTLDWVVDTNEPTITYEDLNLHIELEILTSYVMLVLT